MITTGMFSLKYGSSLLSWTGTRTAKGAARSAHVMADETQDSGKNIGWLRHGSLSFHGACNGG